MGSEEANWAQNSAVLLQKMDKGKPIFETYVNADGSLIQSGGFLGRERILLASKNWTYNPNFTAWMPPK